MTKETLLTELNKNNEFNEISPSDMCTILEKAYAKINKIILINTSTGYSSIYSVEDLGPKTSLYARINEQANNLGVIKIDGTKLNLGEGTIGNRFDRVELFVEQPSESIQFFTTFYDDNIYVDEDTGMVTINLSLQESEEGKSRLLPMRIPSIYYDIVIYSYNESEVEFGE